jgi:DNA polymerase-3 subunit epsilon
MIDITRAPLVLVDVETDGLNAARGHIIEVAALRVENGSVVEKVVSLVNPGSQLPAFITQLTGITDDELAQAPSFDKLADRLEKLLEGAVFVAHNVRFDYSFFRQEFARLGRPFKHPMLCTVKLSRALYPQLSRHKLSDLIAYHGFDFTQRHRAYDDAYVLVQFIAKIRAEFGKSALAATAHAQLKSPAIPKHIDHDTVRALPSTPGVYVFEDDQGAPLYIGKSVNIKKRVMSHFTRDTAEYREFKMSQTVRRISHIKTPGELSALLLESYLIKQRQPLYNRKLRRTRKFMTIQRNTTEQGYWSLSQVELATIDPQCSSNIVGIYQNRSSARRALETARYTFDLCPKLCGLEKTQAACFSYQLRKCRGACIGAEPAPIYNARLAAAFEHKGIENWPFSGPVIIEEQSTVPDSDHMGYIIDKWVVLAQIHQTEGCEPALHQYDAVFDLDAYHILHSYFLRSLHKLHIRPYDHSFGYIGL